MNPTIVIEMLQKTIKIRNVNDSPKKRSSKRTNDEILAELKTPSKPSTMQDTVFHFPIFFFYYFIKFLFVPQANDSFFLAALPGLRAIKGKNKKSAHRLHP